MYKITLLKTSHIDCAESVLYSGGDPNTATTIGCHAFLLQKDDKYYLIDTGIESVDEANKTKSSKADWARFEDEYSIKENLDRLGVDCDKITKVFITHSHYDHISGVFHFKNADFYMTKEEYDLFLNDTSIHRIVNEPVYEFLKDKNIILVDKEMQVDDITLKHRGGHTKGSMSVELGNMLFVGDTVFNHKNIENRVTPGFTQFPQRSQELVNEYADYPGKIVTSHDFKEEI